MVHPSGTTTSIGSSPTPQIVANNPSQNLNQGGNNDANEDIESISSIEEGELLSENGTGNGCVASKLKKSIKFFSYSGM